MAVKQIYKASQAQIVKQTGKQRRTVVEKGNHKSLEKYGDLKLKSKIIKSGNEWIWTTDQGLMSPLLYH
jgi:hypothetical protein